MITFGKLRRSFAPAVRRVFECCPPVRMLAVKMLALKQKSTFVRCGCEFKLPKGDFGVTLELDSTGEYEPLTTKTIEGLLAEGSVFVDIGAHVGLFSVPAMKWVGETGRVIAFEPHPDNYALLFQNVEANGVTDGVSIENVAVSNSNDSIKLYQSPFNTGDHQVYPTNGRKSIDIKCVSLDSYFGKTEQVDVIKMDVQGAEGAAFEGMKRVLQDNPKIVVVWELSPAQLESFGKSAETVLGFLSDLGFSSTIIDDVTGVKEEVSDEVLLKRCPYDSYINVLSSRRG